MPTKCTNEYIVYLVLALQSFILFFFLFFFQYTKFKIVTRVYIYLTKLKTESSENSEFPQSLVDSINIEDLFALTLEGKGFKKK